MAAMAIVGVGAGGQVDLYSSAASDLLVDVVGWIPEHGGYTAVAPNRILDTRFGLGAAQGKVPADGTLTLQVAGRGGVPAGVEAVEVNITATEPEGFGFATTYPSGATRPWASTLNYVPGRTVANSATVRLGSDGRLTLYTDDASHLLVDVLGYHHPGGVSVAAEAAR